MTELVDTVGSGNESRDVTLRDDLSALTPRMMFDGCVGWRCPAFQGALDGAVERNYVPRADASRRLPQARLNSAPEGS